MLGRFKNNIEAFINSEKDTPFLVALICGLTPMLFYYSNNYWAVNSWSHVLFFSVCFLGASFLLYLSLYIGFRANDNLKVYTKQVLFLLLLCFVFVFLIHTFFLTPKKRITLFIGLVVLGFLLRSKPRIYYKKIISEIQFTISYLRWQDPLRCFFIKMFSSQRFFLNYPLLSGQNF